MTGSEACVHSPSSPSSQGVPLVANGTYEDYGTVNGHAVPETSIGSFEEHSEEVSVRTNGLIATIFNLINVYLGLGLLAQAYALQRGGWASLIVMVICCVTSAYTGRLVIKCFERMGEQGYCTRKASWSALAEFIGGPYAKWVVYCFTLAEAFGAGCMALLMLWDNLHGLFPSVDLFHVELMCFLCIVPSMFAQGFGDLAFISVLGAAGKALSTLLPVVVYFTLDPARNPKEVHRDLLLPNTLPMALGIIMLSYSAHVALPSVWGSMRDPSQFGTALNAAFGLMLLQYATMGTFGYLVWGDACSPLITTDAFSSAMSGWQQAFVTGVALLVAWSTYATVVPIITVVSDAMLSVVPHLSSGMSTTGVKLALLLVLSVSAHLCRNRLGIVEVGIGALSMIVTLLIPLVFHWALFGRTGGPGYKAGTLVLLALAFTCLCLVTTSSLEDLAHGMQ